MSNFEILHGIIHTDFLSKEQGYLEECKGKEKKTMKLPIVCKKRDEEYLLYRFDPDERNMFPFFSREKGLQCICDYIALVNKRNILYVLLIELKRGRSSSKKQLDASKCFMEYMVNTAERIGNDIDREKIKMRTIRICETSINRNYTRMSMEYIDEHLDYKWSDFVISVLLN